ncbi:MAG: YkgJ family cysteine cluster protein [Deltaproteobacteria bacterium]|nr:YkgJ family cysteine cluster protein [Deltaproteobacteria bacterium]
MKLQTNPKVVARLAAEHEEDNWGFRSFLKGVDLEIEELDAIVHRHYEAVSSRIDCCACGNCCREILPLLGASDVARLASGLDISETEMIDRFLVREEEDHTFTFSKRPCPFLSGNRCTAYEFRPDDCRSFPHLHKSEFVSRLIQVVQNCAICPIVFNVFERLKDEFRREPDIVWDEEMDWIDV